MIESKEEVKINSREQGSSKLEETKNDKRRTNTRSISPSKKTEGLLVPDKEGYIELKFHPEKSNMTLTEHDRVSVISEFTGWMLEEMTREVHNKEVIYTSRYILKAGLKYKFRFVVNGDPINCQEYPEIKNILRQSYNYIVVYNKNKKSLTKNASYTNIKIDPQVRQKGIQKYFKPIIRKGGKAFPDDLKTHVGRIIYKYKRPEGFYRLLKWNEHAKEATLRRISDNNGIPLDVKKYKKQEYYFLNELNSQFFFVGNKEEEAAAFSMLNMNKLKISYKTPEGANYYEIVSTQPDNIPLENVNYKNMIVSY